MVRISMRFNYGTLTIWTPNPKGDTKTWIPKCMGYYSMETHEVEALLSSKGKGKGGWARPLTQIGGVGVYGCIGVFLGRQISLM
jgi:hypothetical protein